MELFLLVNTESSLSLDSWYANMRDFMVSNTDEIWENVYYKNVKDLFIKQADKINIIIGGKADFKDFINNNIADWFDIIFKQD